MSAASRLDMLTQLPEFLAAYPGSVAVANDKRGACTALFNDSSYASRMYAYDGNLPGLTDFFAALWRRAGWQIEGIPQGQQPNGDTLIAYVKTFGDWTAGLQVNSKGATYTVTASVLKPPC